ncbi:MAG: DUF1573 domain-containing protein [Saprospiraceae bacterium]|nr:MAG: OmpA/MotB domain-containing protein [Bacteroidetes bacterium OLB9]MCO6464691.1 DUF1573 domain-containing protein [Saprospiraceae bacterium]
MKKFSLFTVMALVAVLAFSSCKEKAADDANVPTPEASTAPAMTTTAPDAGAVAAGETPAPTGPTTTIKFDEDVYDWGTIMDGDKMTHVFKFKNTGNEPLIISNAKGSCGCTVPEYPKDAIAPGKSGEIKVVFDSKGKGAVGGKDDTKRVTITANTDPVDTYLTIKGKIDKKAE